MFFEQIILLILNQSAKIISPFTKFIPKDNVVYFLESIYSEQSNNLSYFYDKYIFTENIKNRMYLLMKTNKSTNLKINTMRLQYVLVLKYQEI